MKTTTVVNRRVYVLALASAGISVGLGRSPATGQTREAQPPFEMSAQEVPFREVAHCIQTGAAWQCPNFSG